MRYVERRCFGRVHRLQMELHDGRLVLYGRTTTYYTKQLAQQAALEVANGSEVENRIEVVRSAEYV
jgi:osmotically-inducible protein OsmY